MPRHAFDLALVNSLVEGARADGPAANPAVAWLRGEGALSALSKDTALAAVEAAVRLGLGDLLARAKADAGDKEVRKAAGAGVHRLKAAGQAVAEPVAAQTWSIPVEEAVVLPPMARLGVPDMEGYFPFVAMATGASETVLFFGAAGAGQGALEVEHTHVSRSGRRRVLEDARRDENLIEVPFHAALHLLEKAFEAGGNYPRGWDHLLENLDAGLVSTARLVDPLARLGQEIDEDLLAQVVPLLEGPSAIFLLSDPAVFTGPMEELRAILHSPLAQSELDEAERVAGVFNAMADSLVEGKHREVVALSLEVLALVSLAKGWEDVAGPARHNALALREGRPGSRVPYVAMLVERILSDTVERLRQEKSEGETASVEP